MRTKLFHRLSYLLLLLQIPCFATLQAASSDPINVVGKLKCRCKKSCIEITKNTRENKLLIFGYIREEPEIKDVPIPNDIKNLCFSFFDDRLTPGPCIVKDFFKRIDNFKSDEDDKISVNFNILSNYLAIYAIYAIENVRDYEKERTPFLSAAKKGQLDIGKLLRRWGANINATDKAGNNALHLACLWSKSEPMVTWLLDACKIDIESKGYCQKTPFLCAAGGGQVGIAKVLKDRGANIHAENKDGDNALHLACLYSKSEAIITWLLDLCKIGKETKGQDKMTPFLCAAVGGQVGIAKLLKKRGANINAKDKDGDNALHLACHFGSVGMVTWLLDVCEMGLETKGKCQKTPFLCAANKGQLAIAKRLKERGANIHAKDKYGYNALHFACLYSGSVAMVTWLSDVCKIDKETKGLYEKTPFLCAAEKGQLAIAKRLKERGANIHAKNEYGMNALHMTCFFSGSVDMVTWLLDACKIDIETKSEYKMTPFLYAAEKGQLGIAELLRQQGANIHAKDEDGYNALHLACLFSGSVAMVEWLSDVCKIDKEKKGRDEKTPFHCAAEEGQLAIAKRLKEHGANIHAKNEYGNNALHMACLFSGSVDMVTWLLDACKIDIETKGQYKKTPFLCAAEKGQLGIAELLRQQGANINSKDEDGDNALHLACLFSGSVAMIEWLLDECKIGLETKGFNQKTPFLCAAEKGQLELAKLLRKRRVNINAKSKSGNNALHFACLFSDSIPMVTWLLDVCKLGLETKGYAQRTPFLCAANKGQLGIAKLLKDRGANINAKSKSGNGALHYACLYSGSVAMVTWLLDECKLGLETKGQYEKTPFLCAAEKGQLAIAKLLRQREANIHAKDKDGDNALYYAKTHSNNEQMVNYLQKLYD